MGTDVAICFTGIKRLSSMSGVTSPTSREAVGLVVFLFCLPPRNLKAVHQFFPLGLFSQTSQSTLHSFSSGHHAPITLRRMLPAEQRHTKSTRGGQNPAPPSLGTGYAEPHQHPRAVSLTVPSLLHMLLQWCCRDRAFMLLK